MGPSSGLRLLAPQGLEQQEEGPWGTGQDWAWWTWPRSSSLLTRTSVARWLLWSLSCASQVVGQLDARNTPVVATKNVFRWCLSGLAKCSWWRTTILHKIALSISMRGSPLIDSEQNPPSQGFIYLFISSSLRYNHHITLFNVYNTVIWQMYLLQNDDHNKAG